MTMSRGPLRTPADRPQHAGGASDAPASAAGHPDRDVVTAEEVARMRATLDSFRAGPGFEPGKWKVSDANRRYDVVGERPASVRVRDLTLRVTEQMSDVSLSHQQRLRLLEALVRAGVSSVETSSFGRGHTVEEMRDEVQTAKAVNPDCELARAVGNDRQLRIGRTSGPWTMWDKLDELGVEARRQEITPVLDACKQDMARRGRGLTDTEVRVIALRVLDTARVGSVS